MRNEGLFISAVEQDLGRTPVLTRTSRLGERGRVRILKVVDVIVLNLSLPLGWGLVGGEVAVLPALVWILPIMIALDALWLLLADTFDLYQPKTVHRPVASAWRALLITMSVATLALMPILLLADLPWPGISLAAAGLAFILVPLSRALIAGVLASLAPRRVLLAVSPEAVRAVEDVFSPTDSPNTHLLGYLDGGPPLGEDGNVRIPYLGPISRLGSALGAQSPQVVAIEPRALRGRGGKFALPTPLEGGPEVVPLGEFYAAVSGRLPARLLSEAELAELLRGRRGEGRAYQITRRALDMLFALIGLAALILVGPFIALAIYLEDGGPIFFMQARLGKGGIPFQIYKFRSMNPQPEEEGAQPIGVEDQRVTRVGRLLRGSHLDELPQFINILRGEMSVVGPRPERLASAQEFRGQIPHYDARHLVRPGLTGWALVNMGYTASHDTRLKHEYDLYYVKHQSLWLDLVILMKTLVDTIKLGGR